MRIDVTQWLVPERDALLDLLTSLSPDEWRRPTECPAWDVHGLALHVLGDDLSLLSRQRDEATNGLIRYAEAHPGLGFRELLDGFNVQWVEGAGFVSAPLVVELLRLTGEWTAAFYTSVDLDSTSGEPVGFFASSEPSPYWQVVAREYVERFVHQGQLRRATGRDGLTSALAAPAAAVTVRSFAAYAHGIDAPIGAEVGLVFEGVGGWTLVRAEGHWAVRDEWQGGTAVVTAPAAALSRAFDRDDTGEMVDVRGGELAERIASVAVALLAQP